MSESEDTGVPSLREELDRKVSDLLVDLAGKHEQGRVTGQTLSMIAGHLWTATAGLVSEPVNEMLVAASEVDKTQSRMARHFVAKSGLMSLYWFENKPGLIRVVRGRPDLNERDLVRIECEVDERPAKIADLVKKAKLFGFTEI